MRFIVKKGGELLSFQWLYLFQQEEKRRTTKLKEAAAPAGDDDVSFGGEQKKRMMILDEVIGHQIDGTWVEEKDAYNISKDGQSLQKRPQKAAICCSNRKTEVAHRMI